MRTFVVLTALISNDSDQREKLLDELLAFDDTGDTSATMASGVVVLAPSAVNQQFAFAGVTHASFVLIVVRDGECTVKLNGTGSPAIPVRMTEAGDATALSSIQKADAPGFMCWRGKVDSIHLGNPDTAETATVFVFVVGEAA